MKLIREIPIEELSFKEVLHDETLFALSCHRQSKKLDYDGEEGDELRCSCRPLCMMTAKSLRNLFDNPKEFLIIQIDPEG